MSNTNGHKPPAITDVLRRADRRWTGGDDTQAVPDAYLEHLATFLQPLVGTNMPATPIDDRQLTELRDRASALQAGLDQARAELDSARAELDTARAELDSAREKIRQTERQNNLLNGGLASAHRERNQIADELAAVRAELRTTRQALDDTRPLADQLAKVTAERAALEEQMAAAGAHVCSYPWPDPQGPIQPCVCGRPYPRYLVNAETDEIQPDVEPWSVVFDRLRHQLKDSA